MSDKFNDIFKSKLENHEVPADHLWQSIASNIPAANTGFWKPWMSAASGVVGTAAVATLGWVGFQSDKTYVTPTAQVITPSAPAIEAPKSAPYVFPESPAQTTEEVQVISTPDGDDAVQDSDFNAYPFMEMEPAPTNTVSTPSDTPINRQVTTPAPATERAADISAYFSVVVSDAEDLKYFFFAAQSAADSYQWDLNNGEVFETYQTQSFSYSFEQEGVYQLSLRVVVNGKERSSTQVLKVFRPAQLNLVNAFAPGFDGLNDEFNVLEGARNVARVNSFTVVDSNGKLMYSQADGAIWSGRINGEIAPPGRYLWTLEFTDAFGNENVKRGSIQLFQE